MFCPFGPEGTGRSVEKQYGVENNSMAMLFGVCIGYTALMIAIGYVALVLQLRVRLRRKAATPTAAQRSLAAQVLDLPPYALEFTARAAGNAGAQAGGERAKPRGRLGAVLLQRLKRVA